MAKSPVEVWLWLLLVMQPFNSKTAEILARCGGDATLASRMIRDGEFPFLSEKEKKRAEQVRMGAIRPILEQCRENGIRIVTLDDDEYPEMLRNIKNPPILLFVCGNLEGLNEQISIAAVGARDVSEYGKAAAAGICAPLAKMGIAIVSGLAVGSDTAAHRAALDVGGRTIGVLACGMFVNYPAENAELKREIVANGGALISEMLPNTRTFSAYFHQRNRIISGICSGTLVIEAGEKSGSLLTASHALDQGRDVFCIAPHDIFSRRYAGAVQLLREGAVPVYGYTDIVERLLSNYSDRARIEQMLAEPLENIPVRDEPVKKKTPEKSTPKTETQSPAKPKTEISEKLLSSLDPNEAAVLKLLAEQPSSVDELVERSGLDFSALSETITNLELFGYIAREMDGVYTAV
ncbi:MAG: DNA-protecting protein DprA [Ruminococcaceae bacterium]|nr:DNA-protecting protein DprA [Oscillospiraceae bacterium]